jgi:tetratricopeptide (TPR) repeat protein
MTTAAKAALFSFTPSLMDGETLEAIFVQREALAVDLVERVRESAFTSAKLHTLVIGARGMGKTHLVSLVYHRVQKLPDLQERLLIAWLREEEYGITSFLDLLLRILRALAEADPTIRPLAPILESPLNPPKLGDFESISNSCSPQNWGARGAKDYSRKKSIEERMEELYELAPDEAEAAGVKLLNQLIGERTLWLIAENLDDIFSGLGEPGQQHLRAFLQTHANCTVLATTSRLFNGVQRRSAPFYGFFRPVHLNELTTAEAQQLLINIATWRQQTDLVNFLKTAVGQTRVKAVQHLAGGNPRIYVIFADFLTHQSLEDLVSPFMSLVDALTPYYQARMQFLSPQQRKIVELLCEKKYALPVKTIAQRCFMTPQTASSQLKDLKEKGYVTAEAIGRESYYDIAEPLMRICLGVKKERGEPLRLMVDFLRVWYPKTELQTMQQRFLVPSERSVNLCRYLERALDDSEITDDDPRIQACLDEIQACFDRENYNEALKIAERLLQIRDSWIGRERYTTCLLFLGRYEEAITCYDRFLEIKCDSHHAWNNRGVALGYLGRHEEAITSYTKALEIKSDFPEAWFGLGVELGNLGHYEEAIANYDKALELKPDDHKIWNNRGVALGNLERYEEAITNYSKALEIKPDYHEVWNNRGVALGNLGHYEEAIADYSKALEIKPDYVYAWNNRGFALGELGYDEEAISNYDKALKSRSDDNEVWNDRGIVLDRLKCYEEAINSYDKALEIKPDYVYAWNNRGITLCNLGCHEEAIASYDKALQIRSDYHQVWNNRGNALFNLERYEEAIASYDRALQAKPDCYDTWYNRGITLFKLVRYEEEIASYDKALQIMSGDDIAWYNRGKSLLNLGRYEEAIASFDKALEINPDSGFIKAQRSEALAALNGWIENYKMLETLMDHEKSVDSGFLEKTVLSLLTTLPKPQQLPPNVVQLVDQLEKRSLLPELGVALVKTTHELTSERVSLATATAWRDVWAEVVGNKPEFALPLRLLDIALRYKQAPDDPRVFLELPIEERKILQQALKLE